MIVAGVMSGTSADGIDVALCRITGRGFSTRARLLKHHHVNYPVPLRRKILSLMNASSASVADLARLNFALGETYADAVAATLRRSPRTKLDLVGCHGQTLYHQGEPTPFLGRKIATTWQTGEDAVVAVRLGVPVVSDFRPADMAAGGKGAPLVPFLDYLLFRHRTRGRIVQNLGGIGNLSAIPAGARPEDVVAFDTGPGNMVIDAVTERLFHQPFDRDGRIAARGRVLEDALRWALARPFFRRPPPRTAGREEFGREFVAQFLRHCRGARREDVVATATDLTARSVLGSIKLVIGKTSRNTFSDYLVSGGGARNHTLMRSLAAELAPLGLRIRTTDQLGLPSEAKEAVAFAVLAYQTWHRQPGNVPSATGARHAAVLGKISFPPSTL
jgi:anhydro-N-acetylmuramic acid kinase